MQIRPDQTIIIAEVVNIGNRKSTLTQMFAIYYPNWWLRLIRREKKTFVVMPDRNIAQPLPFEIEPGARWLGAIYQNKEIEELSRSGYLYIGIFHSVSTSPLRQPLVIPVQA